jgi:hypothetical protein
MCYARPAYHFPCHRFNVVALACGMQPTAYNLLALRICPVGMRLKNAAKLCLGLLSLLTSSHITDEKLCCCHQAKMIASCVLPTPPVVQADAYAISDPRSFTLSYGNALAPALLYPLAVLVVALRRRQHLHPAHLLCAAEGVPKKMRLVVDTDTLGQSLSCYRASRRAYKL